MLKKLWLLIASAVFVGGHLCAGQLPVASEQVTTEVEQMNEAVVQQFQEQVEQPAVIMQDIFGEQLLEAEQLDVEQILKNATQEEIAQASKIAKELVSGKIAPQNLNDKLASKRFERTQQTKRKLLILAGAIIVGCGFWYFYAKYSEYLKAEEAARKAAAEAAKIVEKEAAEKVSNVDISVVAAPDSNYQNIPQFTSNRPSPAPGPRGMRVVEEIKTIRRVYTQE